MDNLYKKSLQHLENKEFDEALDGYSTLVKQDPSFVQAWYDLASIYLLHKSFLDGFIFYEYRFLFQSHIIHKTKLPAPFYKGEDLEGKTLFIFAEQGFGDTIQFIRFINIFQLEFPHTKLLVYVQPPLKKLLKFNFTQIQFIDSFEVKEKVDYSLSLLSLPFNLKLTTIDPLDKYLKTDEKDSISLNNNQLNIGICWQGNKGNIRDKFRSVELETLLQFIPENVNLYSLQKDIRTSNSKVIDQADNFTDFYDTASFIESLDLVITVDTAIAHLSGALGKPTFLLLPFLPDWRWGIDDDKSYWYTNTFLFRQDSKNNWDYPLSKLNESLIFLLKGKV